MITIGFLIIYGIPLVFVILFIFEKIFKFELVKTKKDHDPYLDDKLF